VVGQIFPKTANLPRVKVDDHDCRELVKGALTLLNDSRRQPICCQFETLAGVVVDRSSLAKLKASS
jgi:hypothetical protein